MAVSCSHYIRKCSLISPCCNKIYPCRFCHDGEEDHELNRKLVNQVKCLQCGHIQGIESNCLECRIRFGFYFCKECRLYDDTDKGQFHCELCGICRVGGKDNYFHCMKCDICIPVAQKSSHKCVERAARSNCMICLDYLHSSREPCQVLRCGHFLHQGCFQECLKARIRNCPLCNQSII